MPYNVRAGTSFTKTSSRLCVLHQLFATPCVSACEGVSALKDSCKRARELSTEIQIKRVKGNPSEGRSIQWPGSLATQGEWGAEGRHALLGSAQHAGQFSWSYNGCLVSP
jgi:hypothetical protein